MSAVAAEQPAAPKQDPETLVLRARPRRAIRFRRGVIIGGASAMGIALSAIAWMSLAPPSFKFAAGDDDVRLSSNRPPDALAGAPSSYGDVPKLGPPLPGDLGRPILEQQRANAEIAERGLSPGEEAAVAARQRALEAERNARQSALLVSIATGARGDLAGATSQNTSATDVTKVPNGVESVSLDTPLNGPTHRLSAGSVIAASLLTGLNSDLPGLVVAQVTEQVRDSATGRAVLIPQGARLIGRYDSAIKFGQNRAYLSWERLILPDGSSVTLNKMPASDAAGMSGVRDSVDSHGWQLLKGVVLSSLLGLGQTLGPSGEGDIARAIRQSTQQAGSKAGEQLVERQLDVQPTLVVRPGWPVRALVHEDLLLPAWKG